MKKLKLLLAMVALLSIVGVRQANAYTTNELVSAGWTKVTSLTDVANNYYVLIDAGTSDYAMGRLSDGTDKPVYMRMADPLSLTSMVWTLTEDGGNFNINSLKDNKFFISGTAGWNDSMNDNKYDDEGRFTFTLAGGKYSIKSVKTGSWVGPWNNDNKVNLTDGYENIAANKGENQAPGFILYSMPKTQYAANQINASWLTSHGWSQVTDNSALGNVDNYYLIIEKETFGYAMARTSNGRPASKALSNPFNTKNELWIIAARGSGYSLQNTVDNTYFTSAAGDWNTSMSASPNADIIATVSDGVYTLSAGGTSSIGHWRDDKIFPYENENIAANKNDGNRNSYYIYTISKTDYDTQKASFISSLTASATKDAPANLTPLIFNNSDFSVLAKLGWTTSGSAGNQQTGNGAFETWNSSNVSVTQELTNIPAGKYGLTMQMVSGDAGRVPYLYANGMQEYTANVNQQASTNTYDGMKNEIMADENYGLLTVYPFVSNGGNLTIGMKAPSGWVVFDNFRLYYYGPTIEGEAVELPANGDMAANTWYYIDIAAAADNYTATATTLGDIVYTTDGSILIEDQADVTTNFTATNNSLSATRYYVKSSSANNLEIGVASYSYSISDASVDKAYIQPSQTVTVSYTVSTNDPGATLTQDYSGVTLDGVEINVVPGASGFTFTVPANLAAGTEHTLAIPAGAIKYNEENKNAAQEFELKATAVFDGIYFLKVAATYDGTSEGTSAAVGKYLARGMNYGTHATLDKYGLPVQITTDANNETTIQAYDTKRYFFHANSYDCYADQTPLAASGKFTVTVNNGKLLIHNNSMAAGTYLKYNSSAASDANIAVYDDGNGTNSGPIIMWTTEDASAHANVMQSYKDNQAATAAAAAYASGKYASLSGITTVSALEAELEANYIKGDFVSPSAIESISEKYQGGQPGSGNVTETVYSNTINITEPGFYKFSMQAFYRAASNETTQDMHTKSVDFPPVVLFFGDSETQIKSIYDEGGLDNQSDFETETVGGAPVEYNGKWYTNGQHNSVIIFQKDYYHNDVYFYASEPGEYTYGVKYMGFANANMQWFIYSPESVEISSYAAAADAADYTALQDAIDAYDDATWGFETGEYAPYNNVEAINNIAAAKAIDKEAVNSKLLVNSLTTKLALSDANASEVNAFYKGDFDGYAEDTSSPLDYTPNGWTATANFRVMIKNVEDYPGLADASAGTAAMSWSGGITYGETAGYTIPLKANTVYRLQFKAAGWNNETRSGMSVSILNSTDGMALYNLGTPDRDIKGNATNTAGMTSYDVVFATGAAGNYVFHIQSGNNMVVTDFSITKAASQVLEFADGSAIPTYAPGTYPTVKITRNLTAARWATAVYPFAVSNVFIDHVAVLNNYDSASGVLEFDYTPESEPNVPFLMFSKTNRSEIILYDVAVDATANSSATKNEASLIGAYTTTEITNAEKNYVLSNNQIFSVGEAGATVDPYRAYIQLDESTPVKALSFVVDGTATGVDAPVAAEAEEDGVIYNTSGQQVTEDYKGIVIKNGKKYYQK